MNRGAAIAVALVVLLAGGGAGWWLWRKKQMRDLITSILRQTMPAADAQDVEDFAGEISSAMQTYAISTPERRAAFIAQIAEESDQLWHLRDRYGTQRGEEYASGDAYEGRANLGNTEDGDGQRFKGRGLLQVTGRANYQAMSDALGVDFVAAPELLNQPMWAALSACQFWTDHGCNELADAGDFRTITRRINGGTNGLQQRLAFLAKATAAAQGAA